jgi:hypothetical protein
MASSEEKDVDLIQCKILSLDDKIAQLTASISALQREKRAAEAERDKLVSSAQRLKAESIAAQDWDRKGIFCPSNLLT